MSCADIISLSLRFLLEELIELGARLACFSIITLFLALSSVFFEESQEIEDFGVCCYVYHAAGAHISGHLVVMHHYLGATIIGISAVLDNFIFNLLHEVQELFKADATV